MLIIFSWRSCNCDLFHFYKKIALVAGLKVTENTMFDCTKVRVTKKVQDILWDYYRGKGYTDAQIGALFLDCGPKADLVREKGPSYVVEIQDGFVHEADVIYKDDYAEADEELSKELEPYFNVTED